MKQTKPSLTILHTESSLGWGGQERRLLSEALALRRRGHRLLLAVDPRAELHHRARAAGLPVFLLPFSRVWKLPVILELRRRLRQEQVDILNTHSSLDSWLGLAARLGLGAKVRLVRTRHLGLVIQKTWPTRFLYHQADAIITAGDTIKAMITQRVGVPAGRIHPIPTGIDLEVFAPRPPVPLPGFPPPHWPQDAWIMGAIAILRFGKGILYLLDAFVQVLAAEPRARLVIVGDGPAAPAIAEKIKVLGLGDFVHLPGYQEEVASWLSWLEIVILPSYVREGVPQVLLQALAMERAVIGTNCGGIPEIVRPHQTGLLVPPQQIDPLAAAMLYLLQHPEKRRQFGRQGRQMVTQRYSLAAMAQAVEEVYLSIMNNYR